MLTVWKEMENVSFVLLDLKLHSTGHDESSVTGTNYRQFVFSSDYQLMYL